MGEVGWKNHPALFFDASSPKNPETSRTTSATTSDVHRPLRRSTHLPSPPRVIFTGGMKRSVWEPSSWELRHGPHGCSDTAARRMSTSSRSVDPCPLRCENLVGSWIEAQRDTDRKGFRYPTEVEGPYRLSQRCPSRVL